MEQISLETIVAECKREHHESFDLFVPFLEQYLSPWRHSKIDVFHVGPKTYMDPAIWQEYFTLADVHSFYNSNFDMVYKGRDLDFERGRLFFHERSELDKMAEEKSPSIIIDIEGTKHEESTRKKANLFNQLYTELESGGLYVIERVSSDHLSLFLDLVDAEPCEVQDLTEIAQARSYRRSDYSLVVFSKPPAIERALKNVL